MSLPRPPLNQQIIRTKTLLDIGSGAGAGLAALSEDLTINGQTVANTFRYEGKNATTGLWTATTGENLTGAGSGGTVGKDTPLPGLTDKSVNGDLSRYYEGQTASFGDITTEDIVCEMVLRLSAANDTAFGKYLSSEAGWLVYGAGSAGRKDFRLLTGPDVGVNIVNTTMANNTWYHLIFFIDRDGSGVCYRNGDQQTAAVVSGYATSLATSQKMELLSYSSGAGKFGGDLAYCAMWLKDNWLDTHLQATLAQERFARLTGVYSDRYGGPTHTSLRNSNAILEKQGNVGYQRLFTVGPRWPRVETVPDKHNRYASGVYVEGSYINIILRSEEFDNASWTKDRVTVTANAAEAPDGETTADTIHEDATASNTHQIKQSYTGAGSTVYLHACFVKPINRRFARLQYYSVTDLTAGADFDIIEGRVVGSSGVDDAGIIYCGDGWYLIWATDTRATAETQTAYLMVLDDDGSTTSFNGLDQDSFYAWGYMVVAADHPVSYIKTEGSTVARLTDVFRYSVPKQAPLTIVSDVLFGEITNTDTYWVTLGDNTNNNRFSLLTSATLNRSRWFGNSGGFTQFDIYGTAQELETRAWTALRLTAKENDAEAFVNGESVASDTSCAMPQSISDLYIGALTGGAAALDGLIRLRILSRPDAEKDITNFGDIMAKASGYISTPAAVAQSTSYANVGGTFTSVDLTDFTLSAAGVLTYTGTDTKRFAVIAACSGSISSGTPEVTTAMEKNGTEVASSVSKRDVGGSGIGAWAITADIELATNDTLNLATKVDAGTPNLTMEAASIVVHEF